MKAPEAELVALIVEAAERRRRGEPELDRSERAARLVIEIGAGGEGAFERFFETLAARLKTRGLKMPSLDELPAAIAPFAAAFGSAIIIDPSGTIDMEASADALDARMEETMGASPRKLRDAQLREEIRRDMSTSVAESMRRHGLVPLADQEDDDDEDDGPR